jgi:sugar phosphate isomerase/epimerase
VISVDLNDAPKGVPVDQRIDSSRELPAATGVIDLKAFLGSLKEIGYKGPVRAEPFNKTVESMPPDEAVRVTAASLDKAFALVS